MKKWTQVEINIIKTMYLTHRTTNIAKILNRTEYAIERKCRRCNFKRPFAFNSLLLSNKILNSKIKKYNINNNFGWFTSGFVAGEGYFGHCISNKNNKFRFVIGLGARDVNILYKIKSFIGCGHVKIYKRRKENYDDEAVYSVSSLIDIYKYIIPFFNTYKLSNTYKQTQFNIWKEKYFKYINRHYI